MSESIQFKDVLSKLVKVWIVCFGALTIQVVAGYYMRHLWLPYVGFALIMLVIAFGNHNLKTSSINCSMMTHYTVYTLAVVGVVMLVANLFNTHFITNKYSEFSHSDYPYHTAFIVYPVAALMFGISILRRGNTDYCNACRTMANVSASESLRRNVLHHEAKLQLRLSFWLSLMMTVVDYTYYFLYYSSAVPGRRYSPDVFFLYILPATVFVVASIYMYMRYASLQFEVSLKMSQADKSRASSIRYMVVWQDKLLLRDLTTDDNPIGYWDTPAERSLSHQPDISEHQATVEFRKLFDSDRFTLKRLFTTNAKGKTVFHYAAFIDDEYQCSETMLGGQWFTLREIDLMLKSGIISRPFAVEIQRVFTITMAWKTYDREGRRLYPIKNYRPTFRLRDFKNWDVDYEDMHWLSVSENNEDRPFYNLRRWWRKYINGIDNRWKREKS